MQDTQANDAAKADIAILKEVEDEFFPDDEVGRIESKERSVATQTLETGTAPTTSSGSIYTRKWQKSGRSLGCFGCFGNFGVNLFFKGIFTWVTW